MFAKLIILFGLLQIITSSPMLSISKVREVGNENSLEHIERYCQPRTPCKWRIYNYVDYPEIYFMNNYCVCAPGSKCSKHADRRDGSFVEYRCFPKK